MPASPAGSSSSRWTRIALALVALTAIYNAVEAGLTLWAGIAARSIALLGFGLDSLIELAAAVVVLWRLAIEIRGGRLDEVEQAEQRVHKFVGVTLAALAVYVALQATWTLWQQNPPSESPLGIAIAAISLVLMPTIAVLKIRAAQKLGSRALEAEAKETLACAYLSFTLLLGLSLNAAAGWWADPLAALLMVPWLIYEAWEALFEDAD